MNDETLAKARAAVARLREVEAGATPGPWKDKPITDVGLAAIGKPLTPPGEDAPGLVWRDWIDDQGRRVHTPVLDRRSLRTVSDVTAIVDLRNAAPALLRLAEAAGRFVGRMEADAEAWFEDTCDEVQGMVLCIGCGVVVRERAANSRTRTRSHDPDCPALAIDAELEQLAALAGEVGK